MDADGIPKVGSGSTFRQQMKLEPEPQIMKRAIDPERRGGASDVCVRGRGCTGLGVCSGHRGLR